MNEHEFPLAPGLKVWAEFRLFAHAPAPSSINCEPTLEVEFERIIINDTPVQIEAIEDDFYDFLERYIIDHESDWYNGPEE